MPGPFRLFAVLVVSCDEVNLELVREEGTLVWPIMRVMKRYAEGPENGIAGYVRSVAEVDITPPRSGRWWKRG